MEHYVTLFDSAFLPQGLALHASLCRHGGQFTLWVLCMDEEVLRRLEALRLPSLRLVALGAVETPELLAVKGGRAKGEYCWTLTPFTPQIVFERDASVERVTYVDADVFLLKSPRPIFEEFHASGKAVLITDHAYDPEYDSSATTGQYCVQFMTFVRGRSDAVMRWWQERCLEWCFNRVEEGKMGDQKYLDDWPERFPDSVHVLAQLDLLLGPWNARRFPYSRAVAWHFHGLRLMESGRVLLHRAYPVPAVVDQMIYTPYLRELARVLTLIGSPVVQGAANRGLLARGKLLARNLSRVFREIAGSDVVRSLPR